MNVLIAPIFQVNWEVDTNFENQKGLLLLSPTLNFTLWDFSCQGKNEKL